MASITEVATLAGVSTATASRVVSSADYPVSPATRARVLDAARTLDYVPNALARGLLKSCVMNWAGRLDFCVLRVVIKPAASQLPNR